MSLYCIAPTVVCETQTPLCVPDRLVLPCCAGLGRAAKAAFAAVTDKKLPFHFMLYVPERRERVPNEEHALYPDYQMRLAAEAAEALERKRLDDEISGWAHKEAKDSLVALQSAVAEATRDAYDDLAAAVERSNALFSAIRTRSVDTACVATERCEILMVS